MLNKEVKLINICYDRTLVTIRAFQYLPPLLALQSYENHRAGSWSTYSHAILLHSQVDSLSFVFYTYTNYIYTDSDIIKSLLRIFGEEKSTRAAKHSRLIEYNTIKDVSPFVRSADEYILINKLLIETLSRY